MKAKLDGAREAKANAPKEDEEIEQVVILTHTDSKGFTRPVSLSGTTEPTAGRRKAKKVETHAGGKRMRYFADDDKYSLQEMVTYYINNKQICKLLLHFNETSNVSL